MQLHQRHHQEVDMQSLLLHHHLAATVLCIVKDVVSTKRRSS
ncbi:unnamed protein product [Haemonchus placei]|uniref:Uncharacterized protein n=1 Tax=Haemonchus placei TaxID=6290 RepID=A0A3P7WJY7_HAEPC|nr:unnamed protein product [Haemonchus placei]